MELKSGYKQTEVGVIPDEWEVKQVTDFCGFIVPGRNKPKYFDGDIPWITTPDLEDGGFVTESKSGLFVTRNEAKNVGSRIVPTGSIIMTCVGDLGIVAVAKNDVVLNQQLHAFIPSSDVDALFLMYAIKTRQSYLESVATKTALPYLNKDNCNSIQVPFPALPEQCAIATALSDVDALIASLDRLITKKRDMKQAAMQELLTGQRRLPGFSGEWEVKRLGEISSTEKGTQLNASDLRKGGKFAHLNGGMAPSGYTDKQNTQGGTIAISEGGNSCGYVQLMAEQFWCGGHCYAIKPRGVINHFLFQTLKSEEQSIMGLRVGSGLPNVQKTALLAFELHLPISQIEQTAIAAILSDMDTEIAALEQKRDKTRLLKQGMMQELLTGRIRLV